MYMPTSFEASQLQNFLIGFGSWEVTHQMKSNAMWISCRSLYAWIMLVALVGSISPYFREWTKYSFKLNAKRLKMNYPDFFSGIRYNMYNTCVQIFHNLFDIQCSKTIYQICLYSGIPFAKMSTLYVYQEIIQFFVTLKYLEIWRLSFSFGYVKVNLIHNDINTSI